MATGLVIPQDDARALAHRDFTDLTDYQRAVDGYIEAVDIQSTSISMFVNMEGKIHRLPVNRRATLLLWLLEPAFRNRDFICGNAVLVGQADDGGVTQSIPDDFAALVTRTDQLVVQVQTVGDGETWSGNMQVFSDYFDAAAYALRLAERWMAVTAVRVTTI